MEHQPFNMAQCLYPITLKSEGRIVPCYKCYNCKMKRASNWSYRLMQELKVSNTAHFITLTYDTTNVPITQKGLMNLNKRHIQLFMKKLRKKNNLSLKYYVAGEYGTKTRRPHYHMILFNCHINTIQDCWQYGQIHYGTVSEASVGYTLKYISKPTRIPMWKGDDRQKEFSLMSKGIGINYIYDKRIIEWHKNDLLNRKYVNLLDGKKASMPRYYKEKLYTIEEQLLISEYLQAQEQDKQLQLLDMDSVVLRNQISERAKAQNNRYRDNTFL